MNSGLMMGRWCILVSKPHVVNNPFVAFRLSFIALIPHGRELHKIALIGGIKYRQVLISANETQLSRKLQLPQINLYSMAFCPREK